MNFTAGISHAEHTGIGDQLYQLQSIYNIGRSCGWDYLHDPAPRAWVNRDRQSGCKEYFSYDSLLGLGTGERCLRSSGLESTLDLDAMAVVESLAQDRLPPALGDDSLVRIHFNSGLYHSENPTAREPVVPNRHPFGFREKFVSAQADDPIPLPFSHGKIPLVVFLRLMDLVWYESEGRLVIPCFPRRSKYHHFILRPVDLLPQVRVLVDLLGEDACELWIYSDGIPARDWLVERLLRLHPDRAEAESVADAAIAFQVDQFEMLKNCGLPVSFRTEGSVGLIREVVQAFATAPFAFNSRSYEFSETVWKLGFPDLGLRDPELFPVVTPGIHPQLLERLVGEHLERMGDHAARTPPPLPYSTWASNRPLQRIEPGV